jgi:hypothetical protein
MTSPKTPIEYVTTFYMSSIQYYLSRLKYRMDFGGQRRGSRSLAVDSRPETATCPGSSRNLFAGALYLEIGVVYSRIISKSPVLNSQKS